MKSRNPERTLVEIDAFWRSLITCSSGIAVRPGLAFKSPCSSLFSYFHWYLLPDLSFHILLEDETQKIDAQSKKTASLQDDFNRWCHPHVGLRTWEQYQYGSNRQGLLLLQKPQQCEAFHSNPSPHSWLSSIVCSWRLLSALKYWRQSRNFM